MADVPAGKIHVTLCAEIHLGNGVLGRALTYAAQAVKGWMTEMGKKQQSAEKPFVWGCYAPVADVFDPRLGHEPAAYTVKEL